ncbi:MAG: hypothetical protein IPK14_17475 [Blastocatellia bacterium]|nr:hypothetical protein [Blastocatellia bacterium]
MILAELEEAIKSLPKVTGTSQERFFPPAFIQLTAAQKEADKLQDAHISTEHLLLAIAEEKMVLLAKYFANTGC